MRHIEIFQVILQAGVISGTARLLNVSQSNVSRMCNHAEQQLRFALFKHGAKGMASTCQGQRLISELQAFYRHLQPIGSLREWMKKCCEIARQNECLFHAA